MAAILSRGRWVKKTMKHRFKTSQHVPGLCLMMTSSNENIFRVTGPLCGEFIGHRYIPRAKTSDAEPWYFLWSAPERIIK